MIRVLVVDDQILIRAGLVALLQAAPGIEVVGEAEYGEAAVDRAAATRPDVILMDIRMPGLDGTAAPSGSSRRPPTRCPASSSSS